MQLKKGENISCDHMNPHNPVSAPIVKAIELDLLASQATRNW